MLAANNPLARATGIASYLAALELMANAKAAAGGLIGAAIDAVGDLLGGGDGDATQPIPREAYPRLIFIWGLTRVLPVMVTAMSITETHFDFLLNPIEAEVQIGLTVIRPDPCANDLIAQGASIYTATAKEALAIANLANVGGRDRRPCDLLAHGLPEHIALPRARHGGGQGPRRSHGDALSSCAFRRRPRAMPTASRTTTGSI